MPVIVPSPLATIADLKMTPMNRFRRFAPLATVVVLCLLLPQTVSAGLVMRIDTESKFFFMEGTDFGNAFFRVDDFNPENSRYDLQFVHTFATQPSVSAAITSAPQNLFVQGATLPISSGNMNMIRNTVSGAYVFIDLFAFSDITTLTGKGPSETVSYASLPPADQTVFESMIGQTMSLTTGTGYSPISVQAVPEPSTYAMALAGLACGGYLVRRRRKRA